jgi:hypothetical protein
MPVPEGSRCFYCGEPHRAADDPPEHIVADALHGSLKTSRVARACNQRAGRAIDAPLQDDYLVTSWMHLLGLGGRRPVVEATVSGEPKAKVGIAPDMKPKPRSGIEIGNTEATIIASSEEEIERLMARLEKQLAAQGRSFDGPASRREVRIEEVQIPVSVNGVTWLRAAAKMTLGIMSLSQPDEWLDTPSALRLIGWLWDESPVDENGEPKFLVPRSPDPEEIGPFARSPTHTVFQLTAENGTVFVTFNLFGQNIVGLQVEVLEPVPNTCWIMEPGSPCREVGFDDLIREYAENVIRDAHEAPSSG